MARTTTLGIDLAAQPENTAACVVEWTGPQARMLILDANLSNADLVALVERHGPQKVAIDAPFGWPAPFVNAVSSYAADATWRAHDRRPLLLRATDFAVISIARQQPLSVSSDRIAVTAMRCAELLSELAGGQRVDRTGESLVAEVYPAAALRMWGLDPRGYKGSKPAQQAKRAELVSAVAGAIADWLPLSTQLGVLRASDHLLDALLSALIGRALDQGLTLPIPPAQRALAATEGWIHLPAMQPLRKFRPV